ncbi:hypothetical protein [Streptomyces broussonetiae]|uniref:Uncharacterized protein n=1 Tax=Streptomyces broussonetiae TaxID=2686304 RepID=A0ABV5EM75_9ACTN
MSTPRGQDPLPVWQSQVGTGKVFPANPRFPQGEKKRLEPEVERAQRVVDEILHATQAEAEEVS